MSPIILSDCSVIDPAETAIDAASDYKEKLVVWKSARDLLDVGREYKASGSPMRQGALDEAQRAERSSMLELEDATRALRAAIDSMGIL
jgi:hypothetical protein